MLDKVDPIKLDHIHFGSELNRLYFFASNNWPMYAFEMLTIRSGTLFPVLAWNNIRVIKARQRWHLNRNLPLSIANDGRSE
jgi:hypothetical protein